MILPLARVNSRLGLWSVPEPATGGVLQLNSFCGTNMLGAIVANYLSLHDIPFKWFYGQPDEPRFRERLQVTLKALAALKTLKQARIAQIGGLANGFENLAIDERVLEKKLGTYLQTRYTVEEIVERAKKLPELEVQGELEAVRREGAWDPQAVKGEHMDRVVRVNLALRAFARENGYDALALSCWSRFQEVYGVAVCAALSRLNGEGIVTPCEADVTSAVMMLALNALNGGRAALNDLVAFDEADGSLNLWHCGVAPACWADGAGVTWDNHFNIGRHRDGRWEGDGVVAAMRFRPGAVTVSSLNNDFDHLFILSGEVLDKAGLRGQQRLGGAAAAERAAGVGARADEHHRRAAGEPPLPDRRRRPDQRAERAGRLARDPGARPGPLPPISAKPAAGGRGGIQEASMKQAVMTSPGTIEFRDVPVPVPGPGEVLIRMKRIGVCGSDIHVWHGKHALTPYPVVQGHEVSGVIERLGAGVRGFAPGDRVTIQPQVTCGTCYPCTHGAYHICDSLKVMGFQTTGAGSEYFAVEAAKVLKLPADMDFELGAMVEPVAVAVHALSRSAERGGAGRCWCWAPGPSAT